ncbi:MAG: ROK family protein [Planctomycetota bacterium]
MDVIGVDLGGTKALAGRVSPDGTIHSRVNRPTGRQTRRENLLGMLAQAITEAAVGERFAAIGIGVAGQVDFAHGVLVWGNHLGLRDVPFAEDLARRFDVPVRVDNDANLIALGEARFGAGRGEGSLVAPTLVAPTLVALYIGTGIGAGFVLGGEVYRGASGAAAELAHQVWVPGGRRCTCGRRGCFETLVGGWAFDAVVSEIRGPKEAGLWTSHDLREAARQGLPEARQRLEEAEQALAVLCANIVTAMNPRLLVLGGSVLLGDPELAEVCRQGIERYSTETSRRDVQVVMTKLGCDAGLLGAAALAMEGLHVR